MAVRTAARSQQPPAVAFLSKRVRESRHVATVWRSVMKVLIIVNASRSRRGQTGVHHQREVPRLKLGVRVATDLVFKRSLLRWPGQTGVHDRREVVRLKLGDSSHSEQ